MNAIKTQLTELRFSVYSDDVLKVELSPTIFIMEKNGKDFFSWAPNWSSKTEVFFKIRLLSSFLLRNKIFVKNWKNWNFGRNWNFWLTKILSKNGRELNFFHQPQTEVLSKPSVSVIFDEKIDFFQIFQISKKISVFFWVQLY